MRASGSVSYPPAIPMSSLLVVNQGAVGDFILSLPAVEALHHTFPRARLTFLANPSTLEIIRGRPYLATVLDCRSSRWAPLYREGGRAAFGSFGLSSPVGGIFVFGRPSSQILAENLAAVLNAPVHRIDPFPDLGSGLSVIEYQCRQLAALGVPALPPPPAVIAPTPEDKIEAAALVRHLLEPEERLVLIHPGSGGREKIWAPAGWVALTRGLLEQPRVRLGLIQGPADHDILRRLHESLDLSHVLPFDDLRLGLLAGIMSHATFYIGNDSGITHLAAACGVPTIALFGPTDPRLWAPRGPAVQVIRWHPEHPDPAAERIWEQLKAWGHVPRGS
jgi:ADP-heptose:LPS heptosyltransferase